MPHDLRYTLPDEVSRKMIVTAIGTSSPQLYFLSCSYLFVAAFSILEMVRALRAQAPHTRTIKSFRCVFLILSAAVMLLRGVLVLVPFRSWKLISVTFFNLLLPIYLQFVTFSLLIIYFQKALLLIQRRAARVRTCLYPTYMYGCAFLMVLCVVLAGVATWVAPAYVVKGDDSEAEREKIREFDRKSSLYTSVSYFILVALVSLYGAKVYRILSTVAISER